jgi:type VI secretion system secreted protein Hcp
MALVALLLANGTFAQSSSGTSTVFMSITGPDGVLEGEVLQAGREGWHRLQAYSHEIVSPRDAASGLPTGKRQHKPFRIVKLINRSSPLLLNAMVKNDTLPTVLVSVWTPTLAGSEVILLTYKLVNASVASIRPWMPNKNDPSTREYPPAEEISFTYQKIELEFHNGGIIAEDDWETPRAAKSPPEKR